MILADISLGDILLSMLWFFFLFMWIWIFISIITDLFRDHEASGISKVLWTLFLIFLPFLGVLMYLIIRGKGMSERALKQQAAAQKQFDEYVRQTASTGGTSAADELAKLADLKASGAISEDEYQKMKAKVVG